MPLTARDLMDRPHSWREYEPEEFRRAARNDSKRRARKALKRVEDGRWYAALAETHKFMLPLDPDEKRAWANANPDMAEWVGTWAYLNDQNVMEDYTGVEPWDYDL